MAIYAYCLLRLSAEEPWPVLEGIGAHPVFPFRCGKYTTLLSRLNRNFPFTPRSIVEHGQVIARAFETHTVLPMRFGTFFASEKQIEHLIRGNQSELLEAFCRLRGKAEMRLKLCFSSVLSDGASPPPAKRRGGIGRPAEQGIGRAVGNLAPPDVSSPRRPGFLPPAAQPGAGRG